MKIQIKKLNLTFNCVTFKLNYYENSRIRIDNQ
jgi:hypothetical protein